VIEKLKRKKREKKEKKEQRALERDREQRAELETERDDTTSI